MEGLIIFHGGVNKLIQKVIVSLLNLKSTRKKERNRLVNNTTKYFNTAINLDVVYIIFSLNRTPLGPVKDRCVLIPYTTKHTSCH